MSRRMLEVVRLLRDVPVRGRVVPYGSQGTIVEVHTERGEPTAYDVEFADGQGRTLATLTLREGDIS